MSASGHFFQIDAGIDVHGVQHADCLLRVDIAGGVGDEGATAQAGHGGIEVGYAASQGRLYIGKAQALGGIEGTYVSL